MVNGNLEPEFGTRIWARHLAKQKRVEFRSSCLSLTTAEESHPLYAGKFTATHFGRRYLQTAATRCRLHNARSLINREKGREREREKEKGKEKAAGVLMSFGCH